ncbi:DNA alkylation repair protein [Streptomyces sp. NPDC046727]|uniref:DNA alkylation repair protein n=1 Tax=Streptomyces sp. NPDC046727 TaxID=3155373 RepID=UPI0033D77D87
MDTLAVNGAGAITFQDKKAAGTILDRWAIDQDFCLRRSALPALLPGVRADAADLNRLSRYADALPEETAFFIRKAIGWVLRETTRRDHRFVTASVESRIDDGPRSAARVPPVPKPRLTAAIRARPAHRTPRPRQLQCGAGALSPGGYPSQTMSRTDRWRRARLAK